VLAVFAAFVTTGCLGIGGEGRYAQYQQREEALAEIDALLPAIVQYPGARLADRHDNGTRYRVADGKEIEAQPYSSSIAYLVPGDATAGGVMLHFRRVLPARGWRCVFQPRARDELRLIDCRRGHATLTAAIDRRGHYELVLQASDVRPPITVIEGD
jgi:hypothetical protein